MGTLERPSLNAAHLAPVGDDRATVRDERLENADGRVLGRAAVRVLSLALLHAFDVALDVRLELVEADAHGLHVGQAIVRCRQEFVSGAAPGGDTV